MEGSPNCSACQHHLVESLTSSLIENVGIPIVCGLGIGGNILAIIGLGKPDIKSTFHQSLVALSSCDIAFLILILMDYSRHFQEQIYTILFPYFLNPIKKIILRCGTFLTMSITTERYLAVCKPLFY